MPSDLEQSVFPYCDLIAQSLMRRQAETELERLVRTLGDVAIGAQPRLGHAHAAPANSLPSTLTSREREIVEHLCAGQRVGSMAKSLYISEHTVRNHLKHVFRKLGVSSQSELVDRISHSELRQLAEQHSA